MFGTFILWIFDPAYDTPRRMRTMLVIFGIGATFATACGPIELLLHLTGLQTSLFKVLIVVNALGLADHGGCHLLLRAGRRGGRRSPATVIAWNIIAVSIARRTDRHQPVDLRPAMGKAPTVALCLKAVREDRAGADAGGGGGRATRFRHGG